MKNITIDDDAHSKLEKAKEKMKEQGIEKPTHSDALRWLFDKI